MALWQFIAFTVLIGALLVYASVITRRLGSADARLNRIEEALLAKSRSVDSADHLAAAEAKPEIAAGQQGRVGHLTIADLRKLSSRATRSSERLSFPGTRPSTVDSAPTSFESPGALATSSEPLSLLTVDAASGVSAAAATTLASRNTQATNRGGQNPPSHCLPSDDSVAKKNRDMALFLSSQRRRRRARLAY